MIREKGFNPTENPIEVKCEAADYMNLEELTDFQGNLKRLSPKNKERLTLSILKQGFIAPIFIWNNDGEKMILDGHQRIKTLKSLRHMGWDIPPLPVAFIDSDNEEDARQKLLHITSQYGQFVKQELDEWIQESMDSIRDTIRLSDKEMDLWREDIDKDLAPEYEFATELKESHNYVVLYFDNEIDWKSAMSKLGIKTVKGPDSREGYRREGIGRVIRGDEIIRRLD